VAVEWSGDEGRVSVALPAGFSRKRLFNPELAVFLQFIDGTLYGYFPSLNYPAISVLLGINLSPRVRCHRNHTHVAVISAAAYVFACISSIAMHV
jgi:hypothetical protein